MIVRVHNKYTWLLNYNNYTGRRFRHPREIGGWREEVTTLDCLLLVVNDRGTLG